ncbi:MAG: hypothetical protein ACP5E9_07135 [Candidatus Methanospirareceae archaeon]
MTMKCLGTINVGEPTLVIKQCPQCGSEVELFSDEQQVRCSTCGAVVHK